MYSTLNDQLQILQQIKTVDIEHKKTDLESNFKFCLNIMKKNSKSFYFAAQSLNHDQRNGVAALYAFCRFVDDIVDESDKSRNNINIILDELKTSINLLAIGSSSHHPIMMAFGQTMRNYHIPVSYIHELIEGVRMDLTNELQVRYNTVKGLNLYCYRVASTVGLMMVHIFMDNPKPSILARASDLGLAMQLTNILRDIREDYMRGRIYLPREDMDLYGVTEKDISLGIMTDNFKTLIDYEIEKTKGIYKVAELGIKDLPSEVRYTILLSSRVYGDILNQIKRDKYQLLTKRAVVSKKRKLYIALKLKTKLTLQKLNFMN